MEKRNLLLTIAYDGRAYHGWQIQENALSVQEVFQGALRQVIGDDFDVKGCSRTDSGVHANQYCISLFVCIFSPQLYRMFSEWTLRKC